MISGRYLTHYIENNPHEAKDLLLCLFRHLSEADKKELMKGLLGEELFQSLQWCAACRKNDFDFMEKISNQHQLELVKKNAQ